MLRWIRKVKSNKGFRIFMIVGIAVLSFGLVGSYAIWSIPRFSSSSGSGNAPSSNNAAADYTQLEKNITELETSAAQKKDDPKLLEKLGNAYYDLGFQMFTDGNDTKTAQGNLNKALGSYEQVLKLTPENTSVLLQAAYTASILGNMDKAEALYQQGLSLDAKSIDIRVNYGQFLLYGKNDFEGAKKQWQEALKLSPNAEMKKNIQALIDQADQLKEYQKKAETEQKKSSKDK